MSSSNGGNARDDGNNSGSEMPHIIPTQMMWPNHLHQQQQYAAHLQQQHQQHAIPPLHQQAPPQQQHYNEYLYNMHAATFAGTPGPPETYSVLPVGHGNFLKVYHCLDNAGAPQAMTPDAALYQHQQHHAQQQQQHTYHHLPATASTIPATTQMTPSNSSHQQHQQQQPTAQQPQVFNSYELFASNTLMPTPDHQMNLGRMGVSEVPGSPQMQTQPTYLLLNSASNSNANQEETVQVGNTTTNMIINNLVNNWSTNLTGGTYTQFGTPPITPQAMQPQPVTSQQTAETTAKSNMNNSQELQIAALDNGNEGNMNPSQPSSHQQLSPQQSSANAVTVSPNVKQMTHHDVTSSVSHTAASSSNAVNTSTSFSTTTGGNGGLNSSAIAGVNSVPEVKKRIVAEVKPMRMTYSDVLSKMNNLQTTTSLPLNAKQSNAIRNGKNAAGQTKTDNKNNTEIAASNGTNVKRSVVTGGGVTEDARTAKKSPMHENKENLQQQHQQQLPQQAPQQQQQQQHTNNKNVGKRSTSNTISNMQPKPNIVQQKSAAQKQNAADGNNKKRNNNISNNNNKRNSDCDTQTQSNSQKTNITNEKDFNAFYNVTAKSNSDNYERVTKANNSNANRTSSPSVSGSNIGNASTNQNTRKGGKSNSSGYYSNNGTVNFNRSRYSTGNSNSSASYSYSSKRNRSSNFASPNASSANSTDANRNYELAKRFFRAWLMYTVKVLTWLFYLVYDIVVLGFSMVYDRLWHAYDCGLIYAQQLCKDMKQNSNKPNIWLKNYWRRFDARFKKNSRWAFWRLFYTRKPPESSTETFKNGRLPQTGDEAMYSLLNCKGKDAYSILGVPPDSSQEQIRKHYKKIAVLVHPDKNKQAGAEEAFKVLQRAFELIGEPENRVTYDQGLAEALHAEKAWTELHDLLSQLQTKITEAANTIRCSTCGLRHPRKLTERPTYAARECASCKIRHSAREGDIWAETFLFGLRWKYLAMMEGKVYDITEWANCQKGALSHLEPNSHVVQYRIVRGAQQPQQAQPQNQQQQQQQYPQQQPQSHQYHHQQHHSPHHGQQYAHNERSANGKFKRGDIPASEASLHEFLDNLYSGQHPSQTRRRTRRN